MPFKHGKGFWTWARLRDGGRRRVRLGTDDRQVARDIEAMLQRLAGRRDWDLLEAAVNGPSTVGALYDAWVVGPEGLADFRARLADVDLNDHVEAWQTWAKRRASPASVVKYASQLRALVPAGRPFLRSQFTRKVINEALSKLEASGSTARRYHAAWSSFAKYLVEVELVDVNPLRSITPPRNNPPRSNYLSLSETKKLVDSHPEPYRALAALREGAGVEITPALSVRRRDLDEKDRTVHIRGTKNAWRDRPVFVEDWAWPYLDKAAKDKLPDALLFMDEGGRPASYYGARSAHKTALAAAQLDATYTMHDARHSFAVRCIKAGIDPQLIASNLGHQDATMVLRIYGKYRPKAADFRRARSGTDDQ
ncbi:MAG: tyrosine-type recombinase/integrase [Gemmatimonadales bacterium]|nr:tyrosine-type recombinase/integrase [Gemmatimonadales bacterium]